MNQLPKSIGMFNNYLKIAFRQLHKHKLFSALNIFGLATSMSVCMLVIMALRDQYGYDKFHKNGDRIYRVISDKAEKNMPLKTAHYATAPLSLLDPLKENYPFIEQATHVVQLGGDFKINGKTYPSEGRGFAVEQAFLEVFSFGWVAGEQATALTQPRSIVLTETTAKRLFPESEALGTTVQLAELGDFLITGIIPDPPHRSHIRFDFLMSYPSISSFTKAEQEKVGIHGFDEIWRGHTYLLLAKKANRAMLDQALAEQALAYSDRNEKENFLFESQALGDVMPSRDLSNEIGTGTPHIVLYFLLALGLIIILSACFNYMNLSVARSIKRAKEIGVRKVIGARKQDIVLQFLGEAMLISLLAFGVAVCLLEFLIPAFFALDPFVSTIFVLDKSWSNYLIFFGFSLLVGVVAGLFPAFNISAYEPLQAIQQLTNIKLFSRIGIRKALITVQFALSLVFILAVIIVLKQQNHVLKADLGQNIKGVLNVRLQGTDYDVFSQKVSQIKGVEAVSFSSVVMLTGENNDEMAYFNNQQDSMQLFQNYISRNFLDNMGMELVAGKNFPDNANSQGEQFIILNETAVKRMGYALPSEAVGQPIKVDTTSLVVIGVAKDFHHDNIWFSPIQPFGLRSKNSAAYNANIRLSANHTQETVAAIHKVWDEISPDVSWTAFFLDERVYFMSKFFRMGSSIIGFVGFLTIIIACLGLLGMVIYTVEGKVKEVGIRKVLGASEGNIVWQLSKGFLLLLGISIAIAVPITLFVANLWLNNFLLRITVSPWIIGSGIGILLLLGLATVVSQTFWAARTNPVVSLRSE